MVTFLPEVAERAGRAGLPMPALRRLQPAEAVFCVVTTIDARGRLADRSPVGVLSWLPCQPLAVSIRADVVRLVAAEGGGLAVTKQGHVRLPSEIRHAVGLVDGDRVLVVVRPDLDAVVIYPMAVVAGLLRSHDDVGAMGPRP